MEKKLSKIAHPNDGPEPLVSTLGVCRANHFSAIAARCGAGAPDYGTAAPPHIPGFSPSGLQQMARRR